MGLGTGGTGAAGRDCWAGGAEGQGVDMGTEAPVGLGRASGAGTGRAEGASGALWTVRADGTLVGLDGLVELGGVVGSQLTLLGLWQALKALQEMSSATATTPPQPLSRKAKSIPVQTFEVSLALHPALPSFGILRGFQN